jgi:AcrR family transcriptional regulator
MPPVSPALGPARSGDAVRRQILDDAESLLEEFGEKAFSIRKLVARCGHTAPTIYHHFGDKGHLVGELLESRFSELAAELRRGLEMPDAIEQLRVFALAFARFGLANPIHYRLFTLTPASGIDAPPSGEECRRLLAAPLDRLDAQGRVPVGRLDVLRQAFWALIHGAVSLQVMRPDYEWDEQMLEVALDGLIEGTLLAVEPGSGDASRGALEEGS